MKEIKFNTGRKYTPEGQWIEAFSVGDYWNDSDFTQYVCFNDLSRGITCKTTIPCELTEKAIMRIYDMDTGGLLQSISEREFNYLRGIIEIPVFSEETGEYLYSKKEYI